ncbi:pentatricopeptide repeat-containing protein At1g63080, mitochondrial-like isoform X2 [Mangifera indica]|uniref:pentatricopeptide repeat-containing protein At1g63080, mitochondrial-like isoform X2 n=1 Tax=Mangifera indica TaxID=29780 RepID=UPI001CF9BE94|nr:pentatricopeptide repeat-containing protein At1g63080, mitochondrial-like isoform X2 [Mangifera indica]
MTSEGVRPNVFAYNTLLSGLFRNGNVRHAKMLFGRLNIAWEMFNRLHSNGFVPDVITYNIIMHGFCKEGKLEMASKCFSDMEQNGVAPDLVTFNTLMSGFLQNNETLKVVELLHKMKERNVKPDASIGSIILDLLGKHEDYREVLNLLPSFSTQEPTGCWLLSKMHFPGEYSLSREPLQTLKFPCKGKY